MAEISDVGWAEQRKAQQLACSICWASFYSAQPTGEFKIYSEENSLALNQG